MDFTSQDQLSDLISVKPSSLVQVCRLSMLLAGIATIAIAVFSWTDLVLENARATIFLPLAIGVALIVSGLAIGSRWQKPAFWFSVAMIGQTLSLQLINAGYQLRYQHYKPFDELLIYPNTLYAAAILIQAVLVCLGLWKYFPMLVLWVRANLRPWQAIVLLICFFIPTTTLSPEVARYVAELATAS